MSQTIPSNQFKRVEPIPYLIAPFNYVSPRREKIFYLI
jgi:hypothetical protein